MSLGERGWVIFGWEQDEKACGAISNGPEYLELLQIILNFRVNTWDNSKADPRRNANDSINYDTQLLSETSGAWRTISSLYPGTF